MPEIELEMRRDNERGLLAGQDKDGKPLARLADSTLKKRKPGESPLPLIPRRRSSRVIANYRTTSFQRPDGAWVAIGAWQNLLSRKGVPYLPFHLEGRGRLPIRNIAGVRPEGRKNVKAIVRKRVLMTLRGEK
jgi:hypothetical protein